MATRYWGATSSQWSSSSHWSTEIPLRFYTFKRSELKRLSRSDYPLIYIKREEIHGQNKKRN